MEVFVVLLVVVIALVFVWLLYEQNYWRRRGIPHNKPTLFVGNMKEWRTKKHITEILSETYHQYKGQEGPFVGFYFLMMKCVIVLDLELIKNILIKDFHNFQDRGLFHNERDDPLTGNLLFMDGEKWTKLRHKMAPTFTSTKMRYMFQTVVKIGQEVSEVLADKIANADMHGQVMEITNLLERFTADVIGACAFGLQCNSMRNPNAEFVVMSRRFLNERRHNFFIDSLITSFPTMARRLRMRYIQQSVHDFYMGIVKETISYREQYDIKRHDFMDLFIELKNSTGSIRNENGEEIMGSLTVEEVAAQAFVFFVAGYETSSITTAWALFELARHQDIQDQVRDEIRAAMAKHNNEFTYECMKDMQYLDRVIQETTRMYPVIPYLMRKSQQRYETSHPKYYIDKGTIVVIPAHAIHMDPDIYPEPHLFRPERFSPTESANRPTSAWLAFGEGPRNCIGMQFGKMQVAIGLSYLLKSFKFSMAAETENTPKLLKSSYLLNIDNGIHLKVEKV